jgi:hypothetical protein
MTTRSSDHSERREGETESEDESLSELSDSLTIITAYTLTQEIIKNPVFKIISFYNGNFCDHSIVLANNEEIHRRE